jgi:hypothetical protein
MFVIGRVISQEAFGHIRASSRLEEVQSLRYRNDFGAPAHAQFAIDTADLGLNRIDGDDQSFCHLGIGAPSDQQPQHLLLLSREWLDESSLDSVLR